jgi:RNA polymerase-binding transcription factor DksA
MHYHYFTLEQRDALSRQILEMTQQDPGAKRTGLGALHSSGYGICEACEADIPFVRLLQDPFRRLCGRCEREK